jgi:hypothetical protein
MLYATSQTFSGSAAISPAWMDSEQITFYHSTRMSARHRMLANSLVSSRKISAHICTYLYACDHEGAG